jgi:hypothetical protein
MCVGFFLVNQGLYRTHQENQRFCGLQHAVVLLVKFTQQGQV